MAVPKAEQESRRIRWHCRRGLLELDCVLLPFYEQHFDTLDLEDRQAFIHLLDQPDNDILAWLQKRQVPPENDLKLIIAKIV
ncbi:MAG: succinate dehydrogenase assembly factor 2 [Gammaproteobacteria bacterium]|nr:MAG: succinate dehydrogenase assembly factor 2 [Gammaproteobacteria bacterium]